MIATENMRVANKILSQLGGHRFTVITRSKQYAAGENYLRMNLAKNKSGANRLKIELNWMDTYDMTFYRQTIKRKTFEAKITEKAQFSGVYFDMLVGIFEETTGLYTRL